MHVAHANGRSAFLVFVKTPGGRSEAPNYLKSFREVSQPYLYKRDRFNTNVVEAEISPNLPQFPNGTEFALVRQAILLDTNGKLRSTHLTESVQIRHYNDVSSSVGISSEGQNFFEFLISRERLFAGRTGGLMDNGFDHTKNGPQRRGLNCASCHAGSGVYSVNSFLQRFSIQTVTLPPVQEVPVQEQRDAVRTWKEGRFSYGLLQGLWERN